MIDRATAETREVVDLGSPFDGFLSVSRDGRSVYCVRHVEESDVWVATLENP